MGRGRIRKRMGKGGRGRGEGRGIIEFIIWYTCRARELEVVKQCYMVKRREKTQCVNDVLIIVR